MSSHQRPDKILIAMRELSGGTGKSLKYEDIVVKAFTLFPSDFALRGYPQYPDSSDIHKPLYGPLKRGGFVLAANKTFRLTPLGIERANDLADAQGESQANAKNGIRLPRDQRLEIDRMLQSEAFKLHYNDRPDKILDTDFYGFVGCTVRTSPPDFEGRLSVTDQVLRAALEAGYPTAEVAKALSATWQDVQRQFHDLIDRKRSRRKRGKK